MMHQQSHTKKHETAPVKSMGHGHTTCNKCSNTTTLETRNYANSTRYSTRTVPIISPTTLTPTGVETVRGGITNLFIYNEHDLLVKAHK